MSQIAIRAEGLSKMYSIGDPQLPYRNLRETLAAAPSSMARRMRSRLGPRARGQDDDARRILALDNVSFEVRHGEVLGIIGRNGAGKTTLLKILSRITRPSAGRAIVEGQVDALLQVATGFHPELTGRENIYLNGAVLGMSRRDIRARFDEIAAFSGVEKFLNTPIKYYSAGMYVRLAFAVGAHLDPEILVIDEVLAVGDAEFQKKCLAKMSEVGQQGRTVLFVSHNMRAVQSLCSQVMRLEHGSVVDHGEASAVVARYLEEISRPILERTWADPQTAPGGDTVRIQSVSLRPEGESASQSITPQTPIEIEVCYRNLKPGARLNVSLLVSNVEGIVAFSAISLSDEEWRDRGFEPGLYRSVCRIPGGLLNDETYQIEASVVDNRRYVAAKVEDALTFEVREEDFADRGGWYGKFRGLVRPQLQWQTTQLDEGPAVKRGA